MELLASLGDYADHDDLVKLFKAYISHNKMDNATLKRALRLAAPSGDLPLYNFILRLDQPKDLATEMLLTFEEAKMVTMTAVSNIKGNITLESVNLLMKTNIPSKKRGNVKTSFRNSIARYISVPPGSNPVNVKISKSLHICGLRDRTIKSAIATSNYVINLLKRAQIFINYKIDLGESEASILYDRHIDKFYDEKRYTKEEFKEKLSKVKHVIDLDAVVIDTHSVMINYSYEIGFKIHKIALARAIYNEDGITVTYDNRQDAAVKIEIPYKVNPRKSRIVRILIDKVSSRTTNANYLVNFLMEDQFFEIMKLILFSYTIKAILIKILDSDKFSIIVKRDLKHHTRIILSGIMECKSFKSESMKYSSKSRHTFMVYHTGHVNQSSPNPELASIAFRMFKSVINKHRKTIKYTTVTM